MAKRLTKFGATSNMVRVFIPDSSSTTGAGLTGVLFSTSGLVIDAICDNSPTAYHYKSAATATIEDITTIGTFQAPSASNCRFKAVDATNFPGLYEIHFLDGLFDDSGAKSIIVRVAGVTNMAPTLAEIQLVSFDPQDAVRMGLTALPNAAAEAAGGLYTRGTGAGQINQDGNGRVDSNATHFAGTAYATAVTALVASIWNALTSGMSTVGSIGKKLADWTIHSAADVWTSVTRTLTAGTNIALAKGTGVTGFTDLSAADVRTALGLASANLDTQLDALPTNAELATALAAADDAVLAAIAALSIPTAAANASAVWAAATRTLTANTNFNDPTAATIAAAVVAETITELASVPGASPTLKQALALLYMALRNKVLSGASLRIHNDAGTIVATKTQSDDGTTYTEAKAT